MSYHILSPRFFATVLVALLVLGSAAFDFPPSSLQASVPEHTATSTTAITPVISYQGRLLNPTTGAPLSGTFTFVFRIYNVASGGAELWLETKDLTVTNGLFATLLGDTTVLPTAIFNGQDLWLGIKVGADAEAVPRQRIAAVAYALYSANADLLDGQDSAFYRSATNINAGTLAYDRFSAYGDLANDARIGAAAGMVAAGIHTHTGSDIVDGSIGTADLADGSVTSAKIANSGVALADLAANSVNSSKIVDGSVGDADLEDRTMKIGFPANALNHNTGGLISQAYSSGLRWVSNYTEPAGLALPRPTDWDGTTDVTMRVWFYPVTSTAGYVNWFIRPRAWNAGSSAGDASSVSGTMVYVNQANVLKEQIFTIPASTLNGGILWFITLQRYGTGETYRDDVILMAVELSYNAVR